MRMVETRLELPDDVAVLQEMVRSQTRHYEEQRSKSEGMVSARDKTIALRREDSSAALGALWGVIGTGLGGADWAVQRSGSKR